MMDVPRPPTSSWRRYLRFFWPLSVMAVLMHAGRLGQNRALLDYEGGVRELALFVMALAILGPFRSVHGMTPQMVTVIGTHRAARRRCFRFVTGMCAALSVPVLLLAWTPLGPRVAKGLYDVDVAGGRTMMVYLRYLAPLLLLGGWRQYVVGLLVRQERTAWVMSLNTLEQGLMVALVVVGLQQEWPPAMVVGLSALVPPALLLVLSVLVVRRGRFDERPAAAGPATYPALLRYFWPLAATTFMFTLSRPIIFALVMRINGAGAQHEVDTEAIVAALGLAFSSSLIFQTTVNQFRHLMVTFAGTDRRGVRHFIAGATAVVTGAMVVGLVTPLARLFLEKLQRAEGETLQMALDALWPLCLVPIVVAWRNYHHGLGLVEHRTRALAAGGLARNASILLAGPVLLALGLLNHWTAAALLTLAFASEALCVVLTRRYGRPASDDSRVLTPDTTCDRDVP